MISHTGKLHTFFFPSLLWQMPSKKIFLTFDDGPHFIATPIILDILKKENVRATFFLTGKNIAGREALVQRIAEEGHSIGIHAFNHTRSIAFSRMQTTAEILRTRNELSLLVSQHIRLFRPPFGFFSWNTIAAARNEGFILVMWSCLTGDFRKWNNERIIQNAIYKLRGGSILVFHDNDLTQNKIADVLTQTIAAIKQQGFEFGAIR